MTQLQQELLQQQQQNGCSRGQTSESSTLGLSDAYSRLRSFSPTTWFGKPPELSPQACASKGWANTGPDQLTCVSCSAQILCKLPLNPWAEGSAGVVKKYAARLVDAHSQGCRQRSMLLSDQHQHQQQHTTPSAGQQAPRNSTSSSSSLSFPVLPMPKLYGAYISRRQELQQLQLLPQVPASTRALLAAAAARLDPSILSGLAALLQLPVDQLRQEAAATVVVATGSTSTAAHRSMPGGRGGGCPREQALSLIALCGWQPRQLLPPHLLPAAAADASGSLLGVSHLLPRRSHSSSAGQTPAAAAGQGGSSSSAGGSISPACTALECELCGSQVGLWKFTCSGPFYAQQLSSKAMRTLAATAAASSAAAAAAAAAAEAEVAPSAQQAAADSTHAQDQQQLRRAASGSGAGVVSPAGSSRQQASASPEAVFAAMSHTIAGGSLLTAGASGGGSRPASMEAAGPSNQQQQLQPFGSAAAPAFGSPPAVALGSAGQPPVAAAGGGSRLFEGLAAVAAANVLGSPAPVAPAAVGPFGAAVAGLDKDAAAPVFGLQAFEVEEQRTKRRRSSATGPDFAAAAAAAIAAQAAAGPTSPGDAAAGQRASTPATPAAGGTNGTALQQPLGGGGGSAGRGVRAYSKQRSGLAAAVAAATGDAGAADEAVFDPIASHRSWCPWVKESSRLGSTAGSNAGLVAAVRLGWAATVMAVQDVAQEQELAQLAQQPGADGAAVQRDDYSSTAAVLERARQAMELLERDV